ncbi:MAG TPA: hypothetical protein VG295_05930 [Solirubrobacteraceae bacterium]|nr:hypothetical protein [Solirubrobacteraceae bacterium]
MSTEAVAPPRSGSSARLGEGPLGALLSVLRRNHAVVALVLYAAAALIIQRHALAHLGSSCACAGTDPTAYMWALVWWPHAIVHGLNPFVTHVFWVPDSINLAGLASVPGPALVAAPLTALAGPIVSYNVLMLIAPVTGAWFAYRLCLYLTRTPAASILAGYVYGFSTYGIGHLAGHMNLVFTFGAPALVLLTLKRIDGVISARRYLILATIVLIAQLATGTEMLFTMTCLGVVALAAGWVVSTPEKRRRIVGALVPLIGAYVVLGIICSPFLYYALTGPNVVGALPAQFPADALSFAIPASFDIVGGHRFGPVSSAFAGNFAENGTYLGLPVILIVAAWAVTRWRTRAGRILLTVLAVAVVWSLGYVLNIDGHGTIPLPFKLFSHVRGFEEVIPVRIGVYVFLVCAVIVALWLAEPGSSRLRRWPLALLAVIFLFPNANAGYFDQTLPDPAFFKTNLYRQYLHPDEVVLPIPYGVAGPGLLWQARTGMYFRYASGGFYVPPNYGLNPFVQQALTGQPALKPTVLALRSFLAEHHVGAIVAEADQAGVWPRVLARLGLSGIPVGGVLLYRVPASLQI